LLFVVLCPFAVVLLTAGLRGRADSLTPPQVIQFEDRAGFQLTQADIDQLMHPWLASRPEDMDAHKAYVDLSLEARGEDSKPSWGQPDDSLWAYYQHLARSTSAGARNAAVWGLAYCEYQRDSLSRTLALLASISNRRLRHLPLIRGLALERVGDRAAGDSTLRSVIASGPDGPEAVAALSGFLLDREDWAALKDLHDDRRLAKFVPPHILRVVDLKCGAFGSYLGRLLVSLRMPFSLGLLLLALYSTGVWFLLIRWWDAFEKEPWSTSVLAAGLGALSPIGVVFVRDIIYRCNFYGSTGHPVSDFLSFVFVVGLVEESVKIAPVLLLGWVSRRQMNERVDWMIYGCLSALGFSFTENYQYLVRYGMHVGLLRFFLSTPGHLSLTGVLALTVRRIHLHEPHAWRRFAATLMLVSLLHGASDFLIDAPGVSALVPIALDAAWGMFFVQLLSHVVSTSQFRTNPLPYQASCTSWFMGAYALLCLTNYLAVAPVLGVGAAVSKFMGDLALGQVFLLIALIYTRLNIFPAGGMLAPLPDTRPPAAGSAAQGLAR
jgi:RsiW-degrading membrane proteinase PrsW (M82 family)